MSNDQAGGALRSVAATLLEMGCTRLELGATELAEARWRLAQQAPAATVALFFLGVGLVLGVVALAWWVGPPDAAVVLAIGAGFALALAVVATARWQQVLREHAAAARHPDATARRRARPAARRGAVT